ncbi:MAG: signal peptidase II [Chrysiogenales bacterium]|nr:signal peptidase II [Rubrivivax sp.]TFG78561.1 MAG: signal peptidase II [Chrysiogenales bacterium]
MHLHKKKSYLLVILAIIAVDQASKWLVIRFIPLNTVRDVIKGCFRLWHVRNSGAVWGLFSGHDGSLVPGIITALALAALLVVSFFFLRADSRSRLELTSYALILGGALGNVIDRLRLGYVVDFLDAYIKSQHWPTFNVADSCITIGVLLLALSMWRGKCTPS